MVLKHHLDRRGSCLVRGLECVGEGSRGAAEIVRVVPGPPG
jgi:hypothetical protein